MILKLRKCLNILFHLPMEILRNYKKPEKWKVIEGTEQATHHWNNPFLINNKNFLDSF
jgi:hypothetical protein